MVALWSFFFLIFIRFDTLADDEEDEDDEEEDDSEDEVEDVDEPDTDCMVNIVSDAIVLLLLDNIVDIFDVLDDECCFLFSFTAICSVFWAAFMRELRLTNKIKKITLKDLFL